MLMVLMSLIFNLYITVAPLFILVWLFSGIYVRTNVNVGVSVCVVYAFVDVCSVFN